MPIEFTPAEALELLRYGKFTLTTFDITIPAADAATITETPSRKPPAVKAIYYVKKGWGVLTERFNWGGTHRPNKVYYELHQWGKPLLPEPMPLYTEGFYCGGTVRESNVDNVCTHIYAAERIEVQLWNATGASPADVYIDFTVWFYAFQLDYTDKVLAILFKKDKLLEQVLQQLKVIS